MPARIMLMGFTHSCGWDTAPSVGYNVLKRQAGSFSLSPHVAAAFRGLQDVRSVEGDQ